MCVVSTVKLTVWADVVKRIRTPDGVRSMKSNIGLIWVRVQDGRRLGESASPRSSKSRAPVISSGLAAKSLAARVVILILLFCGTARATLDVGSEEDSGFLGSLICR